MQVISPASGETLREYPDHSDSDARRIVRKVASAQSGWAARPVSERCVALRAVAGVLETDKERFARLMAAEMGKPVSQGAAEIDKCAWVCRYYADHAGEFLENQPVASDAAESFIAYRPLGVVLAVMPWNFPFWQVLRFAAPALAAGNAGILKHASNVPGCALAIEEVMGEAGLPEDVFRTLLIGGGQVQAVIENEDVAAVTLTGSTPAGRAVASAAGAALKKTVLELGGSDPYVVLADADLEDAVDKCVTSRLINTGQSCIAAKRFIVEAPVLEAFERRAKDVLAAKSYGDPMESDHDLGPMARADLRDELHDQVMRSVRSGARLVVGGEIPDMPGAYYPPTLLSDVTPGMPAYDEEMFGPVAAIIAARDEDHAIQIANDTPFGLGAAVFTADVDRGRRIAEERLDAGCCFVNDFVRSDPRLPFGGIKQSGYGRELSHLGIREFMNAKTVYVA